MFALAHMQRLKLQLGKWDGNGIQQRHFKRLVPQIYFQPYLVRNIPEGHFHEIGDDNFPQQT